MRGNKHKRERERERDGEREGEGLKVANFPCRRGR